MTELVARPGPFVVSAGRTASLALFGIVGGTTPDEIRARVAQRPPEEPLPESIAHAAHRALVEAQKGGATDAEKVAVIREWAVVKAQLL